LSLLLTGSHRFWKKAYENATNGSAFKLIGNAWDRREIVWKKSEDDREVDSRKKKGGGGDAREV